jgi:hypothetical protein
MKEAEQSYLEPPKRDNASKTEKMVYKQFKERRQAEELRGIELKMIV